MRQQSERAMYVQIEDALASITQQLRSAIQADADRPAGLNGNAVDIHDPMRRNSRWAREIASELGSVILRTLGLPAAIEWHLHQFQKCTAIQCELAVSVTDGFELPGEHAESVFGIYTEALSNVSRHTEASRVAIALTITPLEVSLVVRDNGAGLAGEASRSSRGGIAGMRARAQGHNGLCVLAGIRDAGTIVTVRLPVGTIGTGKPCGLPRTPSPGNPEL